MKSQGWAPKIGALGDAFLPSTLMNPYFWCCERWAKKACPLWLYCWRDLLHRCTRWVSLATNQYGWLL